MSTDARPWLVLAGGGTGGHLYPGIAIANAAIRLKPDLDVTFFGTMRAIDREVIEPRGFELVRQSVQPFPSRPWHWPRFLLNWNASKKLARARFTARRPLAVLGLGGYAAAPPVVVAAEIGITTALFNPDAEPGRANRRLARLVQQVYVQWHDTARWFDGASAAIEVTGCPVRDILHRTSRDDAVRRWNLDPARHTLLITGASQGARSINLASVELSDFWLQHRDWQLLHFTGRADHEAVRTAYARKGVAAAVVDYSEDLPLAYAAADLAIARAGASSLAELSLAGVPAVLLPYPFDRRRHQDANAAVLANGGAAVVVEDAVDPSRNAAQLRPVLTDLMHSVERRRRMSRAAKALSRDDAAETIARRLLDLAN